MSNIALDIMKILRPLCDTHENKMIIPQISNETQVVLPVIPQTPSTPTQIIYPEDTTTNSTISTTKDDLGYGELNALILYICLFSELIRVCNSYRERWLSSNSMDSVDYNESNDQIIHHGASEYVFFKINAGIRGYYNILGSTIGLYATKK